MEEAPTLLGTAGHRARSQCRGTAQHHAAGSSFWGLECCLCLFPLVFHGLEALPAPADTACSPPPALNTHRPQAKPSSLAHKLLIIPRDCEVLPSPPSKRCSQAPPPKGNLPTAHGASWKQRLVPGAGSTKEAPAPAPPCPAALPEHGDSQPHTALCTKVLPGRGAGLEHTLSKNICTASVDFTRFCSGTAARTSCRC